MSTPRRHVFMFQPRFAPLVENGAKRTTIRLPRKREVRVGDILDLRTWTGLPYRSKQRKLREAVCVQTDTFDFLYDGTPLITRGDHREACYGFSKSQREELACGEGFESFADMLGWFERTHGLPFRGTLYRWKGGL